MLVDTCTRWQKKWYRVNPRPKLMRSTLIQSIVNNPGKTFAFCPDTLEFTIFDIEWFLRCEPRSENVNEPNVKAYRDGMRDGFKLAAEQFGQRRADSDASGIDLD